MTKKKVAVAIDGGATTPDLQSSHPTTPVVCLKSGAPTPVRSFKDAIKVVNDMLDAPAFEYVPVLNQRIEGGKVSARAHFSPSLLFCIFVTKSCIFTYTNVTLTIPLL